VGDSDGVGLEEAQLTKKMRRTMLATKSRRRERVSNPTMMLRIKTKWKSNQ
jgi:hypothetical protein